MEPSAERAPEPGLRERKKQKTKAAIVSAALRLFLERGFNETTTDEIAAAAEVAPRTLFRYFPTKEDIVFLDQDLEDQAIVEAFRTRGPDEDDVDVVFRALKKALEAVPKDPEVTRGIMQLIIQTPSLHGKTLEVSMHGEQLIVEGMTTERSTSAEILRARVFAAAFVSMARAAAMHWVERGMRGDLLDTVEAIFLPLKRAFGRGANETNRA